MNAQGTRADAKELRRARLRFAVVFVAVGGALMTLYSFPYAQLGLREDWFRAYLAVYARVTGFVLHLLDGSVRVAGSDIVGRTSLTVAKNCDAMDVNILFAAAVVAFPARWPMRAVGIGAGSALLAAVNVVRIASLYFVAIHWPGAFDVIHAEVWPLAIVGLAVAAFLSWSRWVDAARDARAA